MFYNAILLTGVNLLLRMVSTSFQVYLSGRIGAAGIGLLQLVLSVGATGMTVGMAGIRTTTMYLTAEELGKKKPGHVRWVLKGCALYSILCSGIVGMTVFSAAPWIAGLLIGDMRTVGALRLFSLFLPVTCLCGVLTGYFTAANRIGMLAAVEVAEQLCSMGTTVAALVFWAGDDPGRACQAVVLGSCVGSCLTCLCLIALRIWEKAPAGRRIPVTKRLLQIAAPLALADDFKSGINTVENLMVPRRLARYPHAADPLALFGIICGMVFPVMMFPAAILFGLAELLIPELARCNAAGSRRRIHYLVKRSLRVALIYGIAFGGLLFLLAEDLCIALYHTPEAGGYLKWFSLLVPMLYCDAITDAMIKGLGQQKISVRYNILTSCLDVIFLYLLLPHYGIGGYFASFLATHLLNFILSLRRLLKITGQKIPIYIPLLCAAALIGSVCPAAAVTHPILRACAFLSILGSLLVLFRILSKEDLAWIRGLIKQK